MRFLLIRPIEDSEQTAKDLVKSGASVSIDPVITIDILPGSTTDLTKFQALVFTSANAVRAFQKIYADFSFSVFTVGDKTAKVAQRIGFKEVISADGDVCKLSNTIKQRMSPDQGPLLYLCGEHVAGNLQEDLKCEGFSVTKKTLYRAVAANGLKKETIKHLKTGVIDFIPFYSPRSALIFIELVKNAGLENTLKEVSALCLSPTVEKLISPLNWKNIMTAEKPTQYDLFKMINIEL